MRERERERERDRDRDRERLCMKVYELSEILYIKAV